MKINISLSVLFMALVIETVTANVRLQRSPQQYCGSRLADIMKLLCKGRYNVQTKRSQTDSEIWDYKNIEDYNSIDYPPRSKQEVMSFIPSRLQRASTGRIIEECCYKPCHMSELYSYCAV